jgi:hypothetical protein
MSSMPLIYACQETAVGPVYVQGRRMRRSRKAMVSAAVGATALPAPMLLAPSASTGSGELELHREAPFRGHGVN